MKTLLKRGTLVTMNPSREIHEGDLLIEDDRIASIMPGGSLDEAGVDQILECSGKIIIPGLVSAHTHLTGMFQRGLWDETSFESWSRKSAATEKLFNPSPEDIHIIHSAACLELIRHGVTTALNMFTAPAQKPLECVSSACQAFLDTGIRGILALSLRDRFPDSLGIMPEVLRANFWVTIAREAAVQVAELGSRLSFMLAPSAPQRCTDGLLMSSRELAEELKVGIHTHLAETRTHAEIGKELYGEPIVNHLERIGFLSPDLSVAHCIWLQDQEVEALRRYAVKVVHNPSSNMKLGSGVARVKSMHNKGLTVGLGADSVNAATVYSIFEQMKLSILLPRSLWQAEDWVRPSEAFQMATLGGASAVLLDRIIGSIEAGKKADLVILNPSISLCPMNDLMGELALCEHGDSVETVLVDGRPIMMEKKIMVADEQAVRERLFSLQPRIARAKFNVLQNP